MDHVPPISESQKNSYVQNAYQTSYNSYEMPFQEQTESYQYEFFDSGSEQYNGINPSFAQQQTSFYNSGITHSPQEYSYCPKLITFYNPDGNSTQLSNAYLRLKIDLDLKIYWIVFTSERNFPIFFSNAAYSISTNRLLLHFTPRQIDSRNLYRCDCLFSNIEEIHHCFDTYSHFQSLAQTTQGYHNLLYNNSSLPYTPMPSYSQPFSQTLTDTPEYDMSQYIGFQNTPSIQNIAESQQLLNLPELNQRSTDPSFSNINHNSTFTESTEPEEKIDPLISQRAQSANKGTVTTLNPLSKGSYLSKPSKTALPVDDLFHRINRPPRNPRNPTDSGLQPEVPNKSENNIFASRPMEPTNDFTKTINHQNLHSSILTSNIVQKSSLGFSTNLAFPNSSNDNLGVFQKNNSGFEKEPTNSSVLTTGESRKIHPASEIPFKHPIKQVINNVNKLPGANINEEVSKKRKLSHTISGASNLVKQNEKPQKGTFNNLIDEVSSLVGDSNSLRNAANSLGYKSQKQSVPPKPHTGTRITNSHLGIKGKSARLTDEERMRARLERFSTQGEPSINSNDSRSLLFRADTRSQIKSTGREELSSNRSLSINYNPNFPLDQASVSYDQVVSLSRYSQSKPNSTSSDAALSLLALNDKASTSPVLFLPAVSQSTTRTLDSFVKASEGINDTKVSTKKKSEKDLEAIPSKSTAQRSSTDKHPKTNPTPQNSLSNVKSKPGRKKLGSTQESKNPIPTKGTRSTNTKQKNQVSSVEDAQPSILHKKIQVQLGVVVPLNASSKDAVSKSELFMKNSSDSVKTKLLGSADQVIGAQTSSGISSAASVFQASTSQNKVIGNVKPEGEYGTNEKGIQKVQLNKVPVIGTKDRATAVSQPSPRIKNEVPDKDDHDKLDEKVKNPRKRSSTPPTNTRELRKRQPISYAESSKRKQSKPRSASISGKAKLETLSTEEFKNINLITSTTRGLKNEFVTEVTKQVKTLSKELDKDTQHKTGKQAVAQKGSDSAEKKKSNAKSKKKPRADIAVPFIETSKSGATRKAGKESQFKSEVTTSAKERSRNFSSSETKTSSLLSSESLFQPKLVASTELVSTTVFNSVESGITSAKDITEAATSTKIDNRPVDKSSNDDIYQSVGAIKTTPTVSVATKDKPSKSAPITVITETVIKTATLGDSNNYTHTERPQSNKDKTEKVIIHTKSKEIFESNLLKDSGNSKTDIPSTDDIDVKTDPVDIKSCLPIAGSPDNKRDMIASTNIKSDSTADITEDFLSDIKQVSSLSKPFDPLLEPQVKAIKVQQQTTVQKSDVMDHESTKASSSIIECNAFDTVGKPKNSTKSNTSEPQTVLSGLKSSQPEPSLGVTKSILSTDFVKTETDTCAKLNDTLTEEDDLSKVVSKPISSQSNNSNNLDEKIPLSRDNSSEVNQVATASDLSTTQSKEIGLVSDLINSEQKSNLLRSDNSHLKSVPSTLGSHSNVPEVSMENIKNSAVVPTSTVQPVTFIAKDPNADSKSAVKSKSPAGSAPARISVMEAMLRALPSSAITRKQSLRRISGSRSQIGNASVSSGSKLAIPAVTVSVDLASNDLAASGSSSLNGSAVNTSEVSEGASQTKYLASSSDLIAILDQPAIPEKSNDHAEIASVTDSKTLLSSAHSPLVRDSQSDESKSFVSSHSPVTQRPTKSRKKASNAEKKKIVELSTDSSDVIALPVNVDDSKGLVEKQTSTVTTKLPLRATRVSKRKASSKANASIETVPVKQVSEAVAKSSSDRNQSTGFTTSKTYSNTAKYGTPSKKPPGVARKPSHLTDLRIFRDAVKSEVSSSPAGFSRSSSIAQETKDLLADATMEKHSISTDQTSVTSTHSLATKTSSEVSPLQIAGFRKATEESANVPGLAISGAKNFDLNRNGAFNIKASSANHGILSDVSAFSDVTDRTPNHLLDEGKSVIHDLGVPNLAGSSTVSKSDGNTTLQSHSPLKTLSDSQGLEILTEVTRKRDDSFEDVSSLTSTIMADPLLSEGSNSNKPRSRIDTSSKLPDHELEVIPELKSLEMTNEFKKLEVISLNSRATSGKSASSLGDKSAAPSDTIGEVISSKQTAEVAASEMSPSKSIENETDGLIVQIPSRTHDHIENILESTDEKDEVDLGGSARSRKKPETPIPLRPPSARLRRLRSETALVNNYHKQFSAPFRFVFDDNKRHDVTPDDFIKLNDGEYLNDTLINFYLKYHHQLMMKANEDVAKLVYIFNTFFYEKLAQKDREGNVGYDFVKTWTTKVNLFKMKYVIVPINMKMHWYLAIIYNLPALLREKKENEDGNEAMRDSKAASTEPEAGPSSQALADNPSADEISLDSGLPGAIEKTAAVLENSGSGENQDVIAGTAEAKENSQARVFTRVTRTSTHTYTKKLSKESATRAAQTRKISVEDDCVIFILDSFKSRNYSVLSRTLKEYICKEAMDKLNITVEKQRIITKQVDVPQQNNFCDCGVYLIHYVERFLGAPAKIVELMAKVMKGADRDTQVTNELLRMWETAAIAKKRSMLKSEIIMCKSKQEHQREAEEELSKIFNDIQQQPSQPSLQSGASTPNNNNGHGNIWDLSTDAGAENAGRGTTNRETMSVDDDEDDVVVVDVMKKDGRGQKRGKR